MKANNKNIRMITKAMLITTMLMFMLGCSYGYDTDLTILNNSSYDLTVVVSQDVYRERDLYSDILKRDSATFNLSIGRGGNLGNNEHRNANDIAIVFTFSYLETGEIIREINNFGEEKIIFDFVGIENFTAMYRFVITDELLFRETQELKKVVF